MIRLAAAVLVLFLPAEVFPQEWIEYVDCGDRFSVNFPGQPTVRETTYQPQVGKPIPARIHTVQDGPRRYSMTVVKLAGVGVLDVPGAVAWEASNFRKRGGQVTYDASASVDRIGGHQIHITNADKSLTFAGIYQHAGRLYVLEANVPQDSPGAVHFQQSLMMLDEKAVRVRYNLDADGNRIGRVQNYEPFRCQ
jgi:hypothetical protein